MALSKVTYVDGVTIIGAKNLNDIQDEIILQGQKQVEDEATLKVAKIETDNFNFAMGWKVGDMSSGTYSPLNYRVCSEIVTANKNLCLRTKSGYQLYSVRYNADGTVAQTVSFREAITVMAGTKFSITIRKSPENTSTPADLVTFVNNIYNDRCVTGDVEIFVKPNIALSNPTVRAITELIKGTVGRLSIRANGYDHYLEQYKLDGTQLSDTAWVRNSADYALDPMKNYKVVFRNSSNTAISLADMTEKVAIYTVSTGMDDMLTINADKIADIHQVFGGRPTLVGTTDHVLSFLWFSDIHKEQKQWDRAVQLANYFSSKFAFAIHTGDYVGSDQSSYEQLYQNGVAPKIPLLNVVGNHDVYTNFANKTKATKSATKAIVMPDTSNWGVTWGSGDDAMNYYKDFATEKVRLIVLDLYYDIEAQETWLANLLAEAKTLGYHVLTAMHETSRPIVAWSDNTFNSKDAVALTAGNLNHSATTFDAIIGDFIDGGGVHIANICGHEHADFMGKSNHGVLNIVIGSQHGYFADASDSYRIKETVTEDLLNCVGINKNLGIIKIARIGANVDHYMRGRNVLCYDYINDIVIANW